MSKSESPQRIAVVGGGVSDEHDVSLASAAAVARAVSTLGFGLESLTIDCDGRWRAADGTLLTASEAVARLTACDVAFPTLHGIHGEDGTIAGLLSLCGVPFVGSPVRAGAIGMDKWATKLVANALGISTAPGALADDDPVTHVASAGLSAPYVVKPTTGGSSNGVEIAHDDAALPNAVANARGHGATVLIEEFAVGHEVDIAIFRNADGNLQLGSTLSIGIAEGAVFGRAEKYDGSAQFAVPAPIDDYATAQIRAAARSLYTALECSGVARFDFFVTDAGLVLNEINTAPGMTEQSQVPLMYADLGLDYPALIGALIDAAWSATHGART